MGRRIAPRIPPGRTKEPKSPTNSWNRLATKLRNKNTYVANKLFRPAAVTYQIWVEAKGCEPFWAQLGSFWKPKLIQNPSKPSPNRFQIWFQKQLPPPSGFQTGYPKKYCRNLGEHGCILASQPPPKWRQIIPRVDVKQKLFFTLFFYLPNLPKTSQNPSQNRTKINVFCNLFLSFFRSYVASIFCWFFVDFKSLETLKIALPCRREHYFYKIDVFASNPKIDPKTIEIWVQKSMKIWTSPLPT